MDYFWTNLKQILYYLVKYFPFQDSIYLHQFRSFYNIFIETFTMPLISLRSRCQFAHQHHSKFDDYQVKKPSLISHLTQLIPQNSKISSNCLNLNTYTNGIKLQNKSRSKSKFKLLSPKATTLFSPKVVTKKLFEKAKIISDEKVQTFLPRQKFQINDSIPVQPKDLRQIKQIRVEKSPNIRVYTPQKSKYLSSNITKKQGTIKSQTLIQQRKIRNGTQKFQDFLNMNLELDAEQKSKIRDNNLFQSFEGQMLLNNLVGNKLEQKQSIIKKNKWSQISEIKQSQQKNDLLSIISKAKKQKQNKQEKQEQFALSNRQSKSISKLIMNDKYMTERSSTEDLSDSDSLDISIQTGDCNQLSIMSKH